MLVGRSRGFAWIVKKDKRVSYIVDSYYDKISRGALPNVSGVQSYANPQAYGGTPGWNWQNAQAPGQQPMYGAPQPTARAATNPADLSQQLRQEYKTKYDSALAANESRYGQANTLQDDLYKRALGYRNEQTNEQVPGYYDTAFNNQKLAVTQATKNVSADINQAAVDRGIYNTSGALNRLGGAQVAGAAAMGDIEAKRAAGRYAADQELTGAKIGLIERRQDTYPDFNQLAALEQKVGSGTMEGMQGAMIGGGGGGAYGQPMIGGSGYGMPQGGGGEMTPQQQQQVAAMQKAAQQEAAKKQALRQFSYGRSYALKHPVKSVYAAPPKATATTQSPNESVLQFLKRRGAVVG